MGEYMSEIHHTLYLVDFPDTCHIELTNLFLLTRFKRLLTNTQLLSKYNLFLHKALDIHLESQNQNTKLKTLHTYHLFNLTPSIPKHYIYNTLAY